MERAFVEVNFSAFNGKKISVGISWTSSIQQFFFLWKLITVLGCLRSLFPDKLYTAILSAHFVTRLNHEVVGAPYPRSFLWKASFYHFQCHMEEETQPLYPLSPLKRCFKIAHWIGLIFNWVFKARQVDFCIWMCYLENGSIWPSNLSQM